jgi:hypothetical protein
MKMYIDETTAGTAFGVLGVVNGVGDLVSSLAVGLWTTFGARWEFGYAVVVGWRAPCGWAAYLSNDKQRAR